MRKYEGIVLIKPTLEPEKALEVSNKLVKVLEDNGAKVVSQEKLEKTEKIAFEVKGHNAAYWQIFKFESEPTIMQACSPSTLGGQGRQADLPS